MPEAVGVDLGGTNLRCAVADDRGELLHEAAETVAGLTQEQLIEAIARLVGEAVAARPGAVGVGVGVAATIDYARGVTVRAPNLPFADGLSVRKLLAARVALPVTVDNDANLAALAEHRFGAARGMRDAVLITIGTGIGGGLILDGELYRGSSGAGAELGHTTIDLDGPPCQGNCPNRGCAEVMASGTAIAVEGRTAAEREPGSALGQALTAGRTIDAALVTEAAAAGDSAAVAVLAEVGRRLGAAMSSWANLFNPEAIVVGGGVAGAGELLLSPARAELRARALPPMDRTPVLAAELGGAAGTIGAATLALDEAERSRS